MKKIFVTGSAGFIGFHLCRSLLEDGHTIIGIDNLNNYYSKKLKNDRLAILNNYNNFSFNKVDISNEKKLSECFKDNKFEVVINLAAQAGVRYSIENPRAYLDSNLIGFHNIIELCRNSNVRKLIYASSSSIYGSNKKIPFHVDDKSDHPISLYGATKKSNELVAHSYSHLYNLKTIGLRFFTVYGPWGRPDMAYYLFINNIAKEKPIRVFNKGKMKRDFTYIDDIIDGIKKAITHNYECEIFNLGNNKSEDLMRMIKIIENELGKSAKINFESIQPGDVIRTFADIEKSKELLSFNPKTTLDIGLKKTIMWFKDYYKI